METTQPGVQFFVETPLKTKIRKATKSVPRHIQWRLYQASLVILDLIMLGLAFRLAYYFRFQFSISLFFQIIKPNIVFYQGVIAALIPVFRVGR